AGRLTRSARRLTLHLPARWPWAVGFGDALERLRAIPLLARPLSQTAARRSRAGGSLRRNRRRPSGRIGSDLAGPPSVPHRPDRDILGSSLARRPPRIVRSGRQARMFGGSGLKQGG